MFGDFTSHLPTVWDPNNKDSSIAISGLSVSGGGGTGGGSFVSAMTGPMRLSGKCPLYFEVTVTTLDFGVGVCNPAAPISNYLGADANGVSYYTTGSFSYNGAQGGTPTVATVGSVLGIAVDPVAGSIWVRVGAAGLWNATSGAAPGGSGGYPCPLVFSGSPELLIGYSSNEASAMTLNGGSTAFDGAVPPGFLPINAAINYY